MTPIPSDDTVFRVAPATEADLMRCEPDVPKRSAETPRVPELAWRELSQEQAMERVLVRGESLITLGIAGTGKTTLLKELVLATSISSLRCFKLPGGADGRGFV